MHNTMVRIALVTAFAIFAGFPAQAQDVAGDWQGTLDTGQTQLRLVLHLTKAAGGGLGATIDSLDQGVNGIPVSSVTLKDSRLNLGVDAVNGSYEGKVNADASEIDGTWTQGQSLPLNFKRSAEPVKTTAPRPAKPSDIDGAWQGTLDTSQGKLRVVFHIINTEDGLTATMDSPDQKVNGVPVTSVTRAGAALTIELKAASGKFEGKIASDLKSIEGTWSQGDQPGLPLLLKRQ
jgi:hypothetical protein